jgi:hypothetical protein
LRAIRQDLVDIEASLTEMEATWMDPMAERIIAAIAATPNKAEYGTADVAVLLDADFDVGLAVCRLFLELSKDEFETKLPELLGTGGIGVKRYTRERKRYLAALDEMGVANAMTELVNRPLLWSDLLVERLKGGRGRAVRGQTRGRSLEDFVEGVVREVFGDAYAPRCSFLGKDRRQQAKADFAIPSRNDPRIVIESKGYGATGSKQSDVLGDLRAIVDAKRNDTTFLFMTDGLTWRRRMNDLRRIVAMQNTGEITRIYTRAMREQMLEDLRLLKQEHGL